jgi:hypothetical protein
VHNFTKSVNWIDDIQNFIPEKALNHSNRETLLNQVKQNFVVFYQKL